MAANPVSAAVPVADVAQLRGVPECLQWFTREKQWINEIHLELCRIPAPLVPGVPRVNENYMSSNDRTLHGPTYSLHNPHAFNARAGR